VKRENWMALVPLALILAAGGVFALWALANGPFDHGLSPVLLDLGVLEIRYYGLVYMLAFILAYLILRSAAKNKRLALSSDDLERYILLLIAGVIIGARLFEVLIYNPSYYFTNPLEIVQVWKGGLSFHGGLAGVVFVTWLFSRKEGRPGFAELCDLLALPAMVMLAFGRIANFINGELYGGVSMIPWAVSFPDAEGYRHPVQLYEAAGNALSFGILFFIRSFNPPRGALSGCFLVLYGGARFFMEFFKDYSEYGYATLSFGGLNVAHLLCLLMAACGAYVLFCVFRKR